MGSHAHPPAPPFPPSLYDTFEQMDTGLKTFLAGAVLGALFLLKTLYQMCVNIIYPQNPTAGLPDELTATTDTSGAPSHRVAETRKPPKPQGNGMSFGARRTNGAPTDCPESKQSSAGRRAHEVTKSLLHEQSESEAEEPMDYEVMKRLHISTKGRDAERKAGRNASNEVATNGAAAAGKHGAAREPASRRAERSGVPEKTSAGGHLKSSRQQEPKREPGSRSARR
ncbi:hypothetical protein AB1Y20_019874 [Prymnesium parvum]|uniref:Membrane magnesium transporter n=1 Tax=Prymnesium parvum TaxID=97485 RepID=A0AB34JVE2_PRYPA